MDFLKVANTMANAAHKKSQKKKPAEGSPEEEASESPAKEASEGGKKPMKPNQAAAIQEKKNGKGKGFPPKFGK